VDGSEVTRAVDNRLLTPGDAGVWFDGNLQIAVRSFKVVALGDSAAVVPSDAEQETSTEDGDGAAVGPVEAGDQEGAGTDIDGHLVYSAKVGEHWDLYRYNFANGKNRRLTDTPDNDEWAPAWAHDGETIAYLSDAGGSAQVWLMDLFGRDQRQVTSYAGPGEIPYGAWTPDDATILVTVTEPTAARILALPADGGTLRDFMPSPSGSAAVSPNSSIAYVVWRNGSLDILLADANGRFQGDALATGRSEDTPNFSRDGGRLAYAVGERGGRAVEFLDLTTGERRALPQIGDDSNPVWSPDGTAIACVVAANGVEEVYVRPVDSGEAILLDIVPHDKVWYLAWSA
jgi:TolB protein